MRRPEVKPSQRIERRKQKTFWQVDFPTVIAKDANKRVYLEKFTVLSGDDLRTAAEIAKSRQKAQALYAP